MSSAVDTSPVASTLRAASPPASVRIAYFSSGYPAFSLTFVLNEIRGLRELGFDIVTASINPCDQLGEHADDVVREEEANTFYIKRAGVRALVQGFFGALWRHPLGLLRGMLFTFQLGGSPMRFFYFLEALIVGAWMRHCGRTHLHVHFGNAGSTVALIATRIFPVTLSLTLHGPDEFYDVAKFYLREKIAAASFICCISSYGRSQLMLVSPSTMWHKLVVSRLGVDSAKFSRRLRAIPTDPLEIVCVGRLVGAKGQHILLTAFERLVRERRNVRLRLIGKGPERESLEALAASLGITEQVVFEGAASITRVREVLEEAAIFALPSFAEGIPVALMEAMAMEIPCVSTAIAGIPELIRDGIDGLLVAPSDEIQLAAALTRLIDDPELRRRLGAAGRQRVQADYDLQQSIKGLGEIFQCRL